MADVKISQLPAATTPLAGTEEIPLVQSTTTKKVTVSGLLTTANLGTPTAINLTNATNVPVNQATGVLPVVNGGTGVTTPNIIGGTNISVTGTWPNQTVSATGAAAGNVTGPASATDNAVARYDNTTGQIIQNSGVIISDANVITGGTWNGAAIAVAYGGTGTSTPSIVAGTNVTVSGTWPNQTINATAAGSVTGVTATAPVVSSGGTAPVISMAAATTSADGYLTSTDWNTFNGKLSSGGALGTPSSGTATNLTGLPLTTGVTGLLPVANGGTGTASPALVAGTNVTISGSWPNQTINSSGGGSMTYPGAGIANSTGTAWGTSYTTTGTGTVVALDTSPTFVTPVLGTPTSATLTNATGLPISTGVSGLGTGVATFLATPSSANLATAVTDETGTGSLVFATSPTLVTPALGTPSALVGTNITGTAAGLTAGNVTTNANLTGAVTSVGNATSLGSFSSANLLAALTDETGTGSAVFATSPTLVTPILGTPTSVTLTNATGLPLSTGVTGTLPVANGGTGLTTTPANGALDIGNGTGFTRTTLTAGTNVTITNGAGSITIAASGSGGSGDVVGPASATNNGIVLFDSTTGKLIKDSASSNGLIYGLTVGRGAGGVSSNTALGSGALSNASTTGGFNTALGRNTMQNLTSGDESVAVGNSVLNLATTGGNNVGVGNSALAATTTGGSNVAVGLGALQRNTTASNNVSVGFQALNYNSTGTTNTAIGSQAGLNITTGSSNVCIGPNSGRTNTVSSGSVFIGETAGYYTTGAQNTFVGALKVGTAGCGQDVTTGAKNVIIGAYAGGTAPISATGSNFVILSDGDANIVASTKTGQTFALQGGTLSSGTGIAFPATQSTSSDGNTLDDYEEGTFTPTLTNITATGYTVTGKYVKIGRWVYAQVFFSGGSNFVSTSNSSTIGGLPFTAVEQAACWGVGANTSSYGNGLVNSATFLIPTVAYTNNIVFTGMYLVAV